MIEVLRPVYFSSSFSLTSETSLALPVTFKEQLKDQSANEGTSVTLRCELSRPGSTVEWRKGKDVLKSGGKFHMKLKEACAGLKITDLALVDAGDYSCVCGSQVTSAHLKVNGRRNPWYYRATGKYLHFNKCLFSEQITRKQIHMENLLFKVCC